MKKNNWIPVYKDTTNKKPVIGDIAISQLEKNERLRLPNPTTLADEDCMEILRDEFGGIWSNLRNALTLNLWPRNTNSFALKNILTSENYRLLLMKRMLTMRTNQWEKFIKLCDSSIGLEIEANAERLTFKGSHPQQVRSEVITLEPAMNFQVFPPQGADALTSDIDLPTGGLNTELAIGIVNEKFRSHFRLQYDPGTVFDINIYAKDWIFKDLHEKERKELEGWELSVTPGSEAKIKDGKPLLLRGGRRTEIQEIWSLVKIRRNMEDKEWQDYKECYVSKLSKEEMVDEAVDRFRRVEYEYNLFDSKVKFKKSQIKKEIGKINDDGLTTRASNDLYAEILLRVKALRIQHKEAKKAFDEVQAESDEEEKAAKQNEVNRLGIALSYAIAESLTYANEVYASEGAVFHTVLAQGADSETKKYNEKNPQTPVKRVRYSLENSSYLQAINENVGDALHSLKAYKDVPQYAVYRAGKYVARLIDAFECLVGMDPSKPDDRIKNDIEFYSSYNTLKELGSQSKQLKSKKTTIVGTELEGVPTTIIKDCYFKDKKPEDFRAIITKFGANAAALADQRKVERLDPSQARLSQHQLQPGRLPLERFLLLHAALDLAKWWPAP